jgi:hypothetical protein
MGAFIATFYYFHILFGFAEGVLVDQTDRANLKYLHRFTISVWALFPMVRVYKAFVDQTKLQTFRTDFWL